MRAQGNTVGPDFVHLQVSHPYVHEVEQEWLDDEGQDAHTGAHERTAGRGKPRRDAPVVGQGAGRAGEDPQDPVGADSGGPGSPDLARALVEHPKVQGELSKLPKPVQKAYDDRLDLLRSGQTHSSTHPLSGPLKGWQGTNLNWQYRMVHRNIGNAVHVLSVGNHDESYDAAIRRKASRFASAACGCVFDGPSFTGCDHLAKLGGQEAMRHIAAARKQAVQDPPEGLSFQYQERQSGGSKWPTFHTITAHLPEQDKPVGRLTYFTHPRRRSQGIYVDGLEVNPGQQRQGIGSALMDEMQRMHPDHKIDHGTRTDDGKAWWSGYTQGKTVRRGRTAGQRTAAEDYWMNHRPGGPSEEEDGTAAPAHALDRVFPADVYIHPHYYGAGDVSVPGGGNALRETAQTIKRIRGNPDAPVTMYRALPPEHAHKGFRVGDWVSIHPTYAQTHGLHPEDENKDWPVIKATVPAQHLWNDGNSIDEFGYHGPPVHGEIHYPGGAESAAIVRRQPKQAALPGVEYRHGVTWTGNPNVTAHLPSGERIGELGWDPDTKKIGWVAVYDDEHRRQGVASGMLAKAREKDPEVRHGDLDDPEAFTDAGRAWARHVGAHQVLYHGSLTPFEPGTVLTPESRDPEGSIHSGDWVYATTSPEAARYFGSMHDSSPNTDMPVHVHRVEPIGPTEPDHFLGEREEFSRGNVKAKALRVLDRQQMPGHWAHTAMGMAGPDYEGLTFQVRRNWSSEVGEDEKWLDGNDKHDRRSFHGMMAFIPGREQSIGTLEYSPYKWAEDDKEVHLHGLRVDPEHQRRGVGRALMNEVMRRYPDTPINHGIKTEQGEAFTRATQGVESPKIDNPGRSQTYGEAPYAEHWTLGGKPYDPKTKQVIGSVQMVRPSEVWDHIRTDLRPHRLDMIRDSVAEHGYQPTWDHADGPIKIDLTSETPRVGNGSHRLRVLRDLGLDEPIPMHVTAAVGPHFHVSPAVNRDSIAEHGLQTRERGRIWLWNDEGAARQHHEFLNDRGAQHDLYRVDVTGNRTYADPDLKGQEDSPLRRTVRNPIPPDRIERIAALDPRQVRMDVVQDEDGLYRMTAHHPEHGPVGRLNYHRYYGPTGDTPYTSIRDVSVEPEHRRTGIGTAMVDELRSRYPGEPVERSTVLTTDGKKFWDKVGKLDLRQVRVLNPTTGHDPDLFDGEHLKPAVRAELLRRWTVFCARHGLRFWKSWAHLWFTGGEASEWSGPGSNPNGDFDMQVGLDHEKLAAINPSWAGSPDTISERLNALFWTELNDHKFCPCGTEVKWDPSDGWQHADGSISHDTTSASVSDLVGTTPPDRLFDLTWYQNPNVTTDIAVIRPYAAYDVVHDTWAVHPEHYATAPKLPHGVRKALEGAERYARQILALPEPQRTREAAALFNSWHEDRNAAFGPQGAGVFDYANLRMKALEATGTWQELQAAANRLAPRAAAGKTWFHGTSWENAQSIIENGAALHTNLTTALNHANNYARTMAKFRSPSGRGVVLEGHLDGDEEEHPWGHDSEGRAYRGIAVLSRPGAFVPTHWHDVSEWTGGEEPQNDRREIAHHREARLAPREATYEDYLRGGGMDQVADRMYARPQHHPGDEWRTDQYPGTVGWVGIEHMLPMRHHDGTSNARSPEVTPALEDGFRRGEGWHEPVKLNYTPEDHGVWMAEGNHRLEAARRAGLTHVPVTVDPVKGERGSPNEWRDATFPHPGLSYDELRAKRGRTGVTIHPRHVLPADWLL